MYFCVSQFQRHPWILVWKMVLPGAFLTDLDKAAKPPRAYCGRDLNGLEWKEETFYIGRKLNPWCSNNVTMLDLLDMEGTLIPYECEAQKGEVTSPKSHS